MSITYRNTINTGIHGPSTGQNPLEACFPQSPCPFWAGYQPFADISGTQDHQGTFGQIKWRAADWKITAIGGAGTTLVPQDSQPNTATFVTRATADGDGYNLQWSMDGGTTTQSIFKPTAGTLIIAFARFKMDNVANDAHTKSKLFFGLSEDDAGILASDEDCAGFLKAAAANSTVGTIANDGTATDTADLLDFANDTYISLGMRINGVTSVEFWKGTTAHDMTRLSTQTTVTNIPNEAMALSFEGQTSEAAAITFTLQHLMAAQEAY